MSREFVTSIDLRGNRLLDAVLTLENVTSVSAPYAGAGRIIHDNGVVKFHDGLAWISLTTGTGGAGMVPDTRTLSAGAGLTGGGDLSANRTFDVGAGVGILVTANNVDVNTAIIQARSERGTANGYAPLDNSGLIPTVYLPPLAVNNVFPVSSQAAMLSLTAQAGDMAIRTDTGKTYVLAAEPAASLGNWVEIMATGQVVSVNGQTGVVSITAASLGAAGTATQVIAGAGLVGGGTLAGNVTLDVAGDGNLSIQANQIQVLSAPKWTTPRTVTLAGDVTGSTTLDGSANVTLDATVVGGTGGLTLAEADATFLKPSEILAGTNVSVTTTAGAVTISSTATGTGIEVDEVYVGDIAPSVPFDGQVWINLTDTDAPAGEDALTQAEADALYADINHTHPSTTDFQFNYDSPSTMADPGAGKVRTDTPAGEPSDNIAVSDITNLGIDASQTFASLAVGDLIHFQQLDNADNWGRYAVNAAPTNNTTWWQIPVTAIEQHGEAIAKNKTVLCKFTLGAGGGGGGWLSQTQADARYVNLDGDTMTGPLTLAANPTLPLGVAPKQYVDARVLKTGDTMSGTLTAQNNINLTGGGILWTATDKFLYVKSGYLSSANGQAVLQPFGVGEPVVATNAATKGYVDSRIWKGTQAAYDAIGTKDPTVLYCVKG